MAGKGMMRGLRGNYHLWLWLLFVVALLVRGWGLGGQPPLDDEVAAALSADNYIRHGILGQVMWYHPPLRNWVLYASGSLFGGYSAWGLRFGPVLLGSLSIPLLGYCAHLLFGRVRITLLAAFFLALDPLHVGLSREALQEAMTPCFILAGVLASIHAFKGRGWWWHYVAGLSFGLAAASKWHGLFPWALVAAVYLLSPVRFGFLCREPLRERIVTVIAAYGALPIAIYIAAWFPWLHNGHTLSEFFDFQRFLVLRQYHHEGPEAAVRFVPHRAWHWFIWPVPWNDFVSYQGKAYLNVAMGNFLVWFLTLPALYVNFREWLCKREFATGFSIGLFLVSYLPLVLTTRDVWVFSAPAVIPFAFILSSFAIQTLLEKGTITHVLVWWYIVAVIAVSSLMYPMVTMRTLEFGYTKAIAEFYNPHPEQGNNDPAR